ncbi:MAG: 2-C-methyl-D-erythritol 4-phosphate cytidylyltransferase [Burkholderiales bacterium]|nr:2-C-methyl-D-erythritol 4-phosphate cytidylyltransferase [Burkholderiales bacterium]
MKSKIIALVPAAGTGTRFGDALPKQYLDIDGHPLLFHTLKALSRVSRIDGIAVVLSPDDSHWQRYLADWALLGGKLSTEMVGGNSRGETIANGLHAIATRAGISANDWVMVHDAARPCIRPELIEQFIDELESDPIGGLLALPLADTIKHDDGNLRVKKTVPREGLWRAQTPQMFRFGLLRDALARCPTATDEAQAIESLGHQPKLVMGDSGNLKVTYAQDLKLARMLLRDEQ